MQGKKLKCMVSVILILLFYCLPILYQKIIDNAFALAAANIDYTGYLITNSVLMISNGVLIGLLEIVDITNTENVKKMRIIKIIVSMVFLILYIMSYFDWRITDILTPVRGGYSSIMWLTLSGYLFVSALKKYKK